MLATVRGRTVAGLSVAAFFALLAVFMTASTTTTTTAAAVSVLAVFFAAVALALFVLTVRHLDLSGVAVVYYELPIADGGGRCCVCEEGVGSVFVSRWGRGCGGRQ